MSGPVWDAAGISRWGGLGGGTEGTLVVTVPVWEAAGTSWGTSRWQDRGHLVGPLDPSGMPPDERGTERSSPGSGRLQRRSCTLSN